MEQGSGRDGRDGRGGRGQEGEEVDGQKGGALGGQVLKRGNGHQRYTLVPNLFTGLRP